MESNIYWAFPRPNWAVFHSGMRLNAPYSMWAATEQHWRRPPVQWNNSSEDVHHWEGHTVEHRRETSGWALGRDVCPFPDKGCCIQKHWCNLSLGLTTLKALLITWMNFHRKLLENCNQSNSDLMFWRFSLCKLAASSWSYFYVIANWLFICHKQISTLFFLKNVIAGRECI